MAATQPPTLETARLHLRPHRLEDFALSAAMWADPVVTRFLGGRPFTREEAWARLLRYSGQWTLLGFGFWVVETKDEERFVGEVGLFDSKRDIQPSIEGVPEMGWTLECWAHGKGFASEAVSAALRWADAALAAPRIVCMINPENAPSLRLAAKSGFEEFARTTYRDEPVILLERRT